jgi:hypothetical protein
VIYLERFLGDLDADRFVYTSAGCSEGYTEVDGWCWYVQ